MADRRGASPLAIVLTLAAVLVVFIAGGWIAVSVMATLYATPAADQAAPATASKVATTAPSAPASAADATASRAATAAAAAQATPGSASSRRTFVVVIDPGHQGRADNRQEPIGPGSTTSKPSVASGTEGVVTHNPENVINLAVSLMLRDILVTRPDLRIVMIRTTPNVDIPNSERAKIAAREHADLFIRVHCDGVNDPKVHGLLTMVPAENKWTKPIFAASAKAGRLVQDATLAATGAKDRGILKVGNMSGFNWSTVPSVIVEMGVMTNVADDHKLADPAYQRKLAAGMARGVVEYVDSLR